MTTLDRYTKVLAIIQPVEKELPSLEGFEVTILLIQKEHGEVLDLIRKELEIITKNQFEMTSTTVDADTLATLMVFNKKHSEEVHAFIYSVNVNEVQIPREYTGRPFFEMYAMIEEQKIQAQNGISAIDERLASLSVTWYQELVVLKKQLENLHDEFGAYRNFGLSEYTFVISGWIPKKSLPRTQVALRGLFGNKVVVNVLQVTEGDMNNAPVFYDNPVWVKPFEVVMSLVSLPKYREIDPSPILAVFLPDLFWDHGRRHRVRASHPRHRAHCPAPFPSDRFCAEPCRDAHYFLCPDNHFRVHLRGILWGSRGADGMDPTGAVPRHHVEQVRGYHPDADPCRFDWRRPCLFQDSPSGYVMPLS